MLKLISSSKAVSFTNQELLHHLTTKLNRYLDSPYGELQNAVDTKVITDTIAAANYISLLMTTNSRFFETDETVLEVFTDLHDVVIYEWMETSDLSIMRVYIQYKRLSWMIEGYYHQHHIQSTPGWKGVWLRLVH